jgi:hypothetical protein
MLKGAMGVKLLILGFIIILTSCGGGAPSKAEQKAIDDIENEVKRGIWEIYEALWEYKLDHGGYPEMIYGGDEKGWEFYNANLPEGKEPLTDPLIEGGYLKFYPYNPFIRINPRYEDSGLVTYRKGVLEFQQELTSRPFDPRFGVDGDRMGNALLEPYIFVGPGGSDKPRHMRLCPGQFFYRTYGLYDTPEELELPEPIAELRRRFMGNRCPAYIIGAFGALDTEGGDVIRWTDMNGYVPPEFPYTYEDQYYVPHLDVGEYYVPLRLPELFGGGQGSLLPMYPPWGEEYKIVAGAPDGYRDGVFYVLDWSGQVVEDKKEKKKKEKEGEEEVEEEEEEGPKQLSPI